MRAGASTKTLCFPEGFFPTEGFSRQLDALSARVLIMEDGARYALLVLEMTSILPEEIEALGAVLREATGAAHAFVLATLLAKKLERDLHRLHPTRVPPYVPCGESEQSVTVLTLGDVRLISVKPELNCVTAQQIGGGDPLVRVVTLWNGGAKYMADADSCDRITYESQNSPFMKGAAEKLVACARELLTRES